MKKIKRKSKIRIQTAAGISLSLNLGPNRTVPLNHSPFHIRSPKNNHSLRWRFEVCTLKMKAERRPPLSREA